MNRTLLVEERDHGGRKRGCAAHRVVRDTRQDREPRLRAARAIPSTVALAAAKKPEDLHRVRRWEDIRVARDDHRGRLDPGDLFGEVEVLLHRVAHLAEKP